MTYLIQLLDRCEGGTDLIIHTAADREICCKTEDVKAIFKQDFLRCAAVDRYGACKDYDGIEIWLEVRSDG